MLKRLLGLLGWLGVALVFAAVAIRFKNPELQQWYNGLALAGLACTLLYILSQWREVGRSFSGRHARFGSLAIGSIVVVLAILSAINYLGIRHNKRWDWTAAQQYSLADQTKKVLRELQKPVQIHVFAKPEEFGRFRERLDEYQHESKQVTIDYIDPERQPTAATKYKVTQFNTVVLEYDGRSERVTSDTEQDLTNGLIRVVQGKQRKAYFVQGHGERTPDDSEGSGLSTIAQMLGSTNFGQDKLVLAQQKEIPADATMLIVAGPKSDFFPGEIDLLKGYHAKGGKLLFLLDPRERAESPALTNVAALLKEWGIEIGDDVVINVPADVNIKDGETVNVADLASLPRSDGTFVLAAKYGNHPIMEGLRVVSAYRLARSVSASSSPNGPSATNLVETTQTGWAEQDIKRLVTDGKVAKEPSKGDKAGPVSLAAVVSSPVTAAPAPDPGIPDPPKVEPDAPKLESRVAVFGDSDFVTNAMLGFGSNQDVFLNTVNWLAQQENLIAIRPRDPEDRRITLTAAQQNFIRLLTIFVIPGVVLLLGVQTWWRRR